MMAALHAGGLPLNTDGVRGPDRFNRRGYFEHEMVRTMHCSPEASFFQPGSVTKVLTHKLPFLTPGVPFRVILMSRSIDRVVASQNRMLGERGGDFTDWTGILEEELARGRSLLERRKEIECLEVRFEDLLAKPPVTLIEVFNFLGFQGDLGLAARQIGV